MKMIKIVLITGLMFFGTAQAQELIFPFAKAMDLHYAAELSKVRPALQSQEFELTIDSLATCAALSQDGFLVDPFSIAPDFTTEHQFLNHMFMASSGYARNTGLDYTLDLALWYTKNQESMIQYVWSRHMFDQFESNCTTLQAELTQLDLTITGAYQ